MLLSKFRSVTLRVLAILLAAILALSAYWFMLLNNHARQRDYVEQQLRLRATQTASALATQVNVLISSLEYLAHSLATPQLLDNTDAFHEAASLALNLFPVDSLAQIALADATGQIIYSSLNYPPNAEALPVSIADRPHFQIHTRNTRPTLFISDPLLGRISQLWTIQLSYPVMQQGRLAGVVVLSISPNYVSDYFREVFPQQQDVALLLQADGTYLARSHQQEAVLNRKVPADRPFMLHPEQQSGDYLGIAAVDGIERYYAWNRLQDYPLLVSIGLGRDTALAELNAQQAGAIRRNLLGSVLILAGVFWIAFLFLRLHTQHQLLVQHKNRIRLALDSGDMSSWRWNLRTDAFTYDSQWCAQLGMQPDEITPTGTFVASLFHPDDLPKIKQALNRYLAGDTALFECECHMRHKQGHYIRISNRARIISHNDQGEALEIAGIQTDITQSTTEVHLRHALFNNNAAEILLVTPDRKIRMANQRALSRFTPPNGSLVGQDTRILHLDDASYQAFQSAYNRLQASGRISLEYHLQDAQGEKRWFVIHGNLLLPDQPDSDIIWTLMDSTERHQAETVLAAVTARLQAVIEHFPGGILVEDESGQILITNSEFCQLFGLHSTPRLLTGQQLSEVQQQLPTEVQACLPRRMNSREWQDEITLQDGRTLRILLIRLLQDQQDNGRLWFFQDITRRRRHETELRRLALTDPLTGLANRHAFMEALDKQLDKKPVSGALILLDLDNFKRVNDTYGHPAGDIVLVRLAALMNSLLRSNDLAGRLGGEEFAILLPDTDLDSAVLIGERLRTSLASQVIHAADQQIRITLSAGVALLQGDTKTLIARADAALYQAKHQGRNRIVRVTD